MKVAVIGGGAAGFFAAITAKETYPEAQVVVFEKSGKLLSKVKVSGGGRCNVTNGCSSISKLCRAYPRGGKCLKKNFMVFNTKHAMEWFESRGVPLVIQADGCVFPVSQDSQSIIDCFLGETKKLKIEIKKNHEIIALNEDEYSLVLHFSDKNIAPFQSDKVIVTTGGCPQKEGLLWLGRLDHEIESPVPSLFSFNMPVENITALKGIVVENALVSIQKTKFKAEGALLITHWGMSGPAILKLSSYGARELHALNYTFNIQVNWINQSNNETVIDALKQLVMQHGNKKISNYRAFALPERLWLFLLAKCNLPLSKKWNEMGKKNINKLCMQLTNDIYKVEGKSTFKEEFVTCGGVSLKSIDLNTMQSKMLKNLYFAGEVLDIDAITGGDNLQAAWTTGYIAGKLNN
jgi:predicted Rossmann fold flavoprotein